LEDTYGPVDFIHSLGDNDYWSGTCDAMWKNIGQYYSSFIPEPKMCNYDGIGNWSSTPRFWPTIGNHDWTPVAHGHTTVEKGLPYTEYFSYLGDLHTSQFRGLHYATSFHNMDIYTINSNWNTTQEQAETFAWLKAAMAKGTAPFQLVFTHHPAYSTAHADPPLEWLRQPYNTWNPNRVLFFSGHEHVYERIELDGQDYLINGLGGHAWRYFITECVPTPGSKVRFAAQHGAAIAAVTDSAFSYCFYAADGTVVDEIVYKKK
jgi:hypothetical protein